MNRTVAKIMEGYPDPLSKDVLTGIAEAIWVTAWSRYLEEHPKAQGDRPEDVDGDWFTVYDEGDMPETPTAAFQAANVLGSALEALNKSDLAGLAWDARGTLSRGKHDIGNYVGRILGLESLATGVRWTDRHPGFPHVVPTYFEVRYDGQYLEWTPRDEGDVIRAGGREMGSGIPVQMGGFRQWVVVRVDGDDRDTYAAETLEGALELAGADPGSKLEWGKVEARDAGAARLARPARWMRVNPSSTTWYVVRVDRDDRDTYAGKTLDEAIDLANADEGSVLEYGTVEARDGGAARIMRPARWTRVVEGPHVNPSSLTKKGERMYKAVERGYRAAGDARAKEIAARTVLSAAKHGQRGLVRNPVHKVGDKVWTHEQLPGDIVQIDTVRGDSKVRYEDGIEWWFPTDSLVPYEDLKGTISPRTRRRRRGRRNPEDDDTLRVGQLVVTPDDEVGRVVVIEGNEAQVIHEDRVEGRGPWYWGVHQLLEPHEDAKLEYMQAADRLSPPNRSNPGRSAAMTKPGKHGTLYRFAVEYGDPGEVPLKWYTWAYDQEHALERFHAGDDGGWTVFGVKKVSR